MREYQAIIKADHFQGNRVMPTDNPQERLVMLSRLAGIIDCEGTVYLNRQSHKSARGGHRLTYFPVVRVTNTDQGIVNEFCACLEKLGITTDRIDEHETYAGYGNESRVSIAGMKKVMQLIPVVRPFITAKAQVMDLVANFCAHRQKVVRGSRYTEEDLLLQKAIRYVNSCGTARDIGPGSHVALIPEPTIADLSDEAARAKLAATVECDGSMDMIQREGTTICKPSIAIYNSNESFLVEIRQSLNRFGLAYYYYARPIRNLGTKPASTFYIQGMKRVRRFLEVTNGYYGTYAERASLITEFIDLRMSRGVKAPYGDREREINRRFEKISKDERVPSTTARKNCSFNRSKIQSALHSDMQRPAEMTGPSVAQ